MKSSIILFSRGVRTGKTTELQKWIKNKKGIAGVLTPDVFGRRKLVDISSGKFYDLENNDAPKPLSIGRFLFDNEIFGIGREIIAQAISTKPKWLVLDEVGNLEMDNNAGWEPALTDAIRRYNTIRDERLILTVRDSLTDKLIAYYNLLDPLIINDLDNLL